MDMFPELAMRIQGLSVQILPFLIALIAREYGHAVAAYTQGDTTAAGMGRMTLNPLPHLDLLGTVILPVVNILTLSPIFIGWAKPIVIVPENFKNRRKGLIVVASAGPAANFIVAILAAIAFCCCQKWLTDTFFMKEFLLRMTAVAIPMNCGLGIFNLLPLPPLDGAKLLEASLPQKWSEHFAAMEEYSTFIFLGLLLSGAINIISIPTRFLSIAILHTVGSFF